MLTCAVVGYCVFYNPSVALGESPDIHNLQCKKRALLIDLPDSGVNLVPLKNPTAYSLPSGSLKVVLICVEDDSSVTAAKTSIACKKPTKSVIVNWDGTSATVVCVHEESTPNTDKNKKNGEDATQGTPSQENSN